MDAKPDFRDLVLDEGEKKLVAKDDGVYPDLQADDGVFAVFDTLEEAPKTTSHRSFSLQQR